MESQLSHRPLNRHTDDCHDGWTKKWGADRLRIVGLAVLLRMILAGGGWGQEADGLRVRAEVPSGPHLVGQGFELRVVVAGKGQRPKIEPPRISGAEVWLIGTDLRPISVSGIGGVVSQENLFITRFRVVARRSGALEIPSIRAELPHQTGRSRPIHLRIQPVPLEGRPAEFLGGVGRFGLQAEVAPQLVRVGQELVLRIKVNGSAAWGMTGRPDLKRYESLPIGLRIDPKPEDISQEPPERTFVYRLRPTRSGEAVLPPVAIAAFDPSLSRYITRVTAGLPVRVLAVSPLDLASIEGGQPSEGSGRFWGLTATAWGIAAVVLLGVIALWVWVWVRRRQRLNPRQGPAAARRYAARLARSLGEPLRSLNPEQGSSLNPQPAIDQSRQAMQAAARRVSDQLTRYLQLGIGRPPGALTPDEAHQGVALCSGSQELGAEAARLAASCDGALYREPPRPPHQTDEAGQLLAQARELFEALGRARTRHRKPPEGAALH
jgi:hypothetical protein